MAKKTTTTCDRCGVIIPPSYPMSQTVLPIVTIKIYLTFDMIPSDVDLCPTCRKRFFQWLENAENEEDAHNG